MEKYSNPVCFRFSSIVSAITGRFRLVVWRDHVRPF